MRKSFPRFAFAFASLVFITLLAASGKSGPKDGDLEKTINDNSYSSC
jgi:hypothetical protein